MAGVKGRSGGKRPGSGRKLSPAVSRIRDFIRAAYLTKEVKAAILHDIQTDPDYRLAYYQAVMPRPLPDAADAEDGRIVLVVEPAVLGIPR